MPPREITFFAPGFRSYRTSEYDNQRQEEFVSVSVTGMACGLHCEHCKTQALRKMIDLPASGKSLYDLSFGLALGGTRGILVSGGSDRRGKVPLVPHIPSLIRIRRELGLSVHIHPGLPDVMTCDALAEVGADAVMLDVIGDELTIREVYHLDATPAQYESAMKHLERNGVPTVPHIVIGHYFGNMRGEWNALAMVRRHNPKALVLVILTPWAGRPGGEVKSPDAGEIGEFFHAARSAFPETPVILGCARPLGPLRLKIDRLAVQAGLDGIAFPADGIAAFAREGHTAYRFINGCCTLPW
jgi:uncharacterized radical SAM superfamily protein